jgi:hypothetical protein
MSADCGGFAFNRLLPGPSCGSVCMDLRSASALAHGLLCFHSHAMVGALHAWA